MVGRIPAAECDAPGAPEAWSAKDFVANITLWKRLHAGKLQMAMRGEPLPEWTDEAVINPLNDAHYRTWQHRPWQEVWAEERLRTDELIAQLERMSEAELTATAGEDHHVDGGTLWPELLANEAWFPYHQLIDLCERRGDAEGAARVRAAAGVYGSWRRRAISAARAEPGRLQQTTEGGQLAAGPRSSSSIGLPC